ncbi:MAG: phosphoenolpyruvate--protein phosphotransferase [Pseudomonadota bacterium]
MAIEKTRPAHGGHGERGITVLLKRMHDVVATEATAQERLDDLTKVIAAHVVADVCSIYLRLPNDELELFSTQGLNREAVHQTRLKWGEGLVGATCATQKPLVTADAPLHPAFSYRPETGEDPLHSFLGVPLIRSGKALGVLVLQNKISRRYTDDEIQAAQAVATLLAEIAASGELLDEDTTQEVDQVLHGPVRLEGKGLVPGIAIGTAAFHDVPMPKHKVFADDTASEAQRLESALDDLRTSVDDLLASGSLAGVSRDVLETYRLFAYDRGWKERLRAAVFSGLTAESAVEQVQAENRARMMKAKDPYLRDRLHDLDDLSFRLLRHLSGEIDQRDDLPENAIVIARVMGPADLLEIDRARLQGLVLGEASTTSHVAIVARALGIPLVTGVSGITSSVEAGDDIIIDGETGDVQVRPNTDVNASYREKAALRSEQQAAFARERDLPFVSADGVEFDVMMNAGLALDMPHLASTGANGVGLFRTELQFLIGAQLPRMSAQQKLYTEVLDLADGKPVVFRTADLGGDKSADYMVREEEANPAMGWRGMRMAIDRPGILRPQIRALLAAAVGRELRVLFPMVTLADELVFAREIIDKETDFRRRCGHDVPSKVLVGAMIEVPSAAWQIGEIAKCADFLSIGGNDLAQFFFAADRDTEQTQARYDPLDRSFLGFLHHVLGNAEKADMPISYCGEQAANLVTAAALAGVGVRRFSLPASAVGGFRRMIRSVTMAELTAWTGAKVMNGRGSLRRELALWLREQGILFEG